MVAPRVDRLVAPPAFALVAPSAFPVGGVTPVIALPESPALAHGWVRVQGVRLHYLSHGPAARVSAEPPLVLLHGGGLGSAALTYELSLAALAARRPVLAIDWPGYGASDRPADAPHTTDWYIAVLHGLLDALGIETADLCGLSMGGGVALGFALAHPRRVGRLVLVNSHGLGQAVPCAPLSRLLVRLPHCNTLSWGGVREWERAMRRGLRSVLADPAAITDDLVQRACALVRDDATARAWWAWQRSEVLPSGFRTDYAARLHALAPPTLLLHSAGDRIVPLRYAARAAARIPQGTLRVFHGCGHWLMREQPAAFADTVNGFLAA